MYVCAHNKTLDLLRQLISLAPVSLYLLVIKAFLVSDTLMDLIESLSVSKRISIVISKICKKHDRSVVV